jgi:hypothetical protein
LYSFGLKNKLPEAHSMALVISRSHCSSEGPLPLRRTVRAMARVGQPHGAAADVGASSEPASTHARALLLGH